MCTGCARIEYAARNATNANWYATTPPSTRLPTTIDVQQEEPDPGVLQHRPRRQVQHLAQPGVGSHEPRHGTRTPSG